MARINIIHSTSPSQSSPIRSKSNRRKSKRLPGIRLHPQEDFALPLKKRQPWHLPLETLAPATPCLTSFTVQTISHTSYQNERTRCLSNETGCKQDGLDGSLSCTSSDSQAEIDHQDSSPLPASHCSRRSPYTCGGIPLEVRLYKRQRKTVLDTLAAASVVTNENLVVEEEEEEEEGEERSCYSDEPMLIKAYSMLPSLPPGRPLMAAPILPDVRPGALSPIKLLL